MAWLPLAEIPRDQWNPAMNDTRASFGLPEPDEIWLNDRYQVVVAFSKVEGEDQGRDGMCHLSIHAHDRGPMRNWRHLQQIKNEVCGEDRWAVEVFPAESELVDSANEFHLWVMPTEMPMVLGFTGQQLVSDDEQTQAYNDAPHKGRQEPWEPGLTTGRNAATKHHPILDAGSTSMTGADIRRARDQLSSDS